MAVQIVSFYDEKKYDPDGPRPNPNQPLYGRVWDYLHNQLGLPIKADTHGSCFRGKNGETAILTDDSTNSPIHEVVLVNVSSEIIAGLEKIMKNK
jgi:hypothetical protein